MKTLTLVSGGTTSAYLAANYPSDYLVFSLVRIEDENCKFKDEKIRRLVEDKIQAPFIATAEDDLIIYTMLDLEQFLGKEINWVTGHTFDQVIKPDSSNWLPNKLHRYCTQYLKVDPVFYWWQSMKIEPVYTNFGYRANEAKRAEKMMDNLNKDGIKEYKGIVGKHPSGKNKWAMVPFQVPRFPLIKDGIKKDKIVKYWEGKPVRFAPYNNCVGCFHRNPAFLRFMYQEHPGKMEWFEKHEGGKKGYWKDIDGKVVPYARIKKMLPQMTLFNKDFTSCDAGYCGM